MLKRLLFTIFAFVCVLASSSAWAFGLGDMSVFSNLGQPLYVSLPVNFDPNSDSLSVLNESCFKLLPSDRGLPSPRQVSLDLTGVSEGKPVLSLRTARSLSEPILDFTIALNCGGTIKRGYTLFIDPVPSVSPPSPPVIATSEPASVKPASTPAIQPSASQPEQKTAPSKPAKPAAARPRKPSPSSRPGHAGLPHPVLTLSGSHAATTKERTFLKLDMTLPDPGRILTGTAPPTVTEQDDENTALQHKLIHLEQQLLKLQARNDELQKKLELERTLPPQGQTSSLSSLSSLALPGNRVWLYALLILLLTVLAVVFLLRSRRKEYIYEDAGDGDPEFSMAVPPSITKEIVAPPEISVAKAAPQHEFERELLDATTNSRAVLHDSLHDEIEVFVAHQHTDLAIQRLEEEIRLMPSAAPTPWLLLLGLLHHEQRTGQYNATRKSFLTHFNVNMPPYGNRLNLGQTTLMDSHPDIVGKLTQLWPGEAAAGYLNKLLHYTKGESRPRFDLDSFYDILFLHDLLKIRGFDSKFEVAKPQEEQDPLDFSSVRGLHRF